MDRLKLKRANELVERISRLATMKEHVQGNSEMRYSMRHDMYQEINASGLIEEKIKKLEKQLEEL